MSWQGIHFPEMAMSWSNTSLFVLDQALVRLTTLWWFIHFGSVSSRRWIHAAIKSFQHTVCAESEQPSCDERHKPHPEGLFAKCVEYFCDAAGLIRVHVVTRNDKEGANDHEYQSANHQPEPAYGIGPALGLSLIHISEPTRRTP